MPPESLEPLRYTQLSSLPDEAVMQHLQAGNRDALAVLFDRYHRLVLSIALRILRDAGEAEDLMQAVFLEIFETAAQFDPARGTPKVWILQFAYSRGFNRRKYLGYRGVYAYFDETQGDKHRLLPPQKAFNTQESARLVEQALDRLSKLQRTTLEMAFFEGLTMREIARKTGESYGSVRHCYYRGLEKLRSLLCEQAHPSEPNGARREVPDAQP
jgi:RNA polymerase sigma-70 factor, ECF subfamily